MILQLDPQIPVYVEQNAAGFPMGKGSALGWLDYSQEHQLIWIIAMQVGGRVYLVPNQYVSLQLNLSLERYAGPAP